MDTELQNETNEEYQTYKEEYMGRKLQLAQGQTRKLGGRAVE